jgi:uncharacterized membrane protein
MTAADRLVSDYLDRLQSELSGFPRQGRREVLDEVKAHIAEARAELAPDDEVGVRNVLERLGDPAEIAAEAQERVEVRRTGTTWREVCALLLLPLGGFVVFVGWFVGVVLLWTSDAWTTRDKWIGTLILPGGLLLPAYLLLAGGSVEACVGGAPGQPATCTGGGTNVWLAVLAAIVVLAPFFAVGYLLWRLKKSPA